MEEGLNKMQSFIKELEPNFGLNSDKNSDNQQYAHEIIAAIKENEKPKNSSSFFGKVGNFFGKAKTSMEGKIKEINFSEKAKVIANKTKEAAITTKVFVNDKSKEFVVRILNLCYFYSFILYFFLFLFIRIRM